MEGDYDTKPPEAFSLRVFVRSPMTDRTWPSSRPIQFDETRKKWKASKIRTGGKSGEERIVGIAILGQNAKALCSYSDVVGDDITDLRKKFNQHISVPGIATLTSDFVVSHKITVIHA